MRVKKTAICIGLISALFFAVPLASEGVVSHYRRWQASKLLSTLRQIRPGMTSEEEARTMLVPFSAYEDGSATQRKGTISRQLEYQFYNSPEWVSLLAYHLRFIPVRFTLPWTLFEAHIDFINGLVAGIHIVEMQEDQPGFPHPNSASVSLLSSRTGQVSGKPLGVSS